MTICFVKKAVLAGFFCVAVNFAWAQSGNNGALDTAELEQNLPPVNFINYEGPHSRIDTRAQIRAIGYGLGLAVRTGQPVDNAVFAGSASRYFIYHSVTPPVEGRLNADIFGLGPDAGVDHIRNLRLIIQGYLEAAYDYSAEDAALLAEFSTIYNAVFRGNWNYFSTRYMPPLVAYLSNTPDKAGLSVRFDEWPGQTLIMLPLLTAAPGSLSAVDTSSLTDNEVIDRMRTENADRGVDSRQDMVDLLEREAEDASRKAADLRAGTDAEAARLQAERDAIDEARSANEAESERIEAERNADDAALTEEERAEREAQLQKDQNALAENEKALDEREATLAEDAKKQDDAAREAQNLENFAAQKQDEAQEQRDSIAKDQNTLIAQGGGATGAGTPQSTAQGAAQAAAGRGGVLAIALVGAASSLGSPVTVDAATGRELYRGALNTVDAQTLRVQGGRAFAIAGRNTGEGAVRLVEIDSATLEIKAQGDDDIAEGSPLWFIDGSFYALTPSANGLHLARFDTNLALLARSAASIHPNASVNQSGARLLVQAPSGSVLSLDSRTLE